MLAHDSTEVCVVADLVVRVPRSAPGDLFDGAKHVVDAVDAVTRVDAADVAGVTPNLNDLFVEVSVAATIRLDGPVHDEADAARSALLDGFGVDAVDVREVDRPRRRGDG